MTYRSGTGGGPVYDLHRRDGENGTRLAIPLAILGDDEGMGEIDWFVSVDSTTVRSHHRAPGAVLNERDLQAALD